MPPAPPACGLSPNMPVELLVSVEFPFVSAPPGVTAPGGDPGWGDPGGGEPGWGDPGWFGLGPGVGLPMGLLGSVPGPPPGPVPSIGPHPLVGPRGSPKNPMAMGALFWQYRIGFQSSLPVVGSMYLLRRNRMSLVFTSASMFGG